MKYIILIISIAIYFCWGYPSIFASPFQSFREPSGINNNTVIYFNEYTGNVIEHSLEDNSTVILLSLPSAGDVLGQELTDEDSSFDRFEILPQQINVSQNHDYILFQFNNIDLGSNYDFYSEDSSKEYLWWIYNRQKEDFTQLSERFTSVGWYSDTKIIYVFDDREVAVAPINDLGNFRILTTEVPGSVDPSQRIIANEDHQLIPLEDGYLIGNQGSFTFHRTSGEAQALPSQDRFLIHSSTRIDILDWNGETITSLENLRPLAKALMPSEDSLILLFESGELVLYALDGSVQENVLSKDFISDVSYATVDDPSEIVIVQSGNVFVFNAVRNQIQSVIQDTPDSPIEISTDAPRLQRIGAESFSSIGLFVIGVFLIISMILGLFLWKKRKSTN